MDDLIEAFTIFKKYVKAKHRRSPTHCEHDTLMVLVEPGMVSEEDTKRLSKLGFEADEENERFYSFRFGSA